MLKCTIVYMYDVTQWTCKELDYKWTITRFVILLSSVFELHRIFASHGYQQLGKSNMSIASFACDSSTGILTDKVTVTPYIIGGKGVSCMIRNIHHTAPAAVPCDKHNFFQSTNV